MLVRFSSRRRAWKNFGGGIIVRSYARGTVTWCAEVSLLDYAAASNEVCAELKWWPKYRMDGFSSAKVIVAHLDADRREWKKANDESAGSIVVYCRYGSWPVGNKKTQNFGGKGNGWLVLASIDRGRCGPQELYFAKYIFWQGKNACTRSRYSYFHLCFARHVTIVLDIIGEDVSCGSLLSFWTWV